MNNIITQQVGLDGEYRLVVNEGKDNAVDTGWFHNLILDQGLDQLGALLSQPLMAAQVGTGNSTPLVTQTGLDAFVAGKVYSGPTPTTTNEGVSPYRTTITMAYQFAQGAVVGNISEVGVGPDTTGNTLFSRALILDSGGSPTTLTLIAMDQLTIYYRLRITPFITDTAGSVTLAATSYNYTSRIALAANPIHYYYFLNTYQFIRPPSSSAITAYSDDAVLGTITSAGPTASSTSNSSLSVNQGYVSGNYYSDNEYTMAINTGNFAGGIGAIMIGWGYPSPHTRFQYLFDTPIPKSNTQELKLILRLSWARL